MSTLYELRTGKGLSQQAVADALQMSRVNYTNIENGKRNLTKENALRLAELFGVSVDELFGRSDKPAESFGRQIVVKPVPEYTAVISLPIVASLRCGFGQAGDPYTVIGHHEVPVTFQEKWGNGLVLNEAVGNSMSPTIRPHDLMVCSYGDWWDDGMIVVVNVNDSDTVKRIYHAEDGGIDLVPDNPAYKSVHYTPVDITDLQITVLGHVLTIVPPDIQPIPRRKDS